MENKSKLNKTIYFDDISEEERKSLRSNIIFENNLPEINSFVDGYSSNEYFINKTICGNSFTFLNQNIESHSIPLIIIDPPYNLSKKFSDSSSFNKVSYEEYESYIESILIICKRLLTPNGTLYLCNDWSGSFIQKKLSEYFYVKNCITWERNKGRGSKTNWKNCSETIWFCTQHKTDYIFNADAVKVKHKVVAPYRNKETKEKKDWLEDATGKYRYTYESNFWKNLVIPFWSVLGNCEHPTQKPVMVFEKLVLASSQINDVVLDFFSGVGTTAEVCKKTNRKFISIEKEERFCILAEKRLSLNIG